MRTGILDNPPPALTSRDHADQAMAYHVYRLAKETGQGPRAVASLALEAAKAAASGEALTYLKKVKVAA
jgi:hypothetical protein